MCLMDSEREKELQRITENLVAENFTGPTQLASHCLGQMGCKLFTQLQVQKLFTPHTKQVYKVCHSFKKCKSSRQADGLYMLI